MPNRIIKDTIRTSKKVNDMTDFQFRLWVYLITYVDDYGRGSADPELIKGFVFPRRKSVTETQIKQTLTELASKGFILLYKIDGESYFYFPTWSEHQRIQTKKSKYPAPPKLDGSTVPNLEKNYPTVNHGDPPPESNPIQSESNTESEYESNPSVTPAHARSDTKTRSKFVKPTIDEIRAYCEERKNSVDSERFFDFYESKGWMIGQNRMRDWKAAVRTWEKSQVGNNKQEKQSQSTDDGITNPFLRYLQNLEQEEEIPTYDAEFTEDTT